MAVFNEREQVFRKEGLTLGEFDPSAEGLYRNVKTFSFSLKKRRAVEVNIRSDAPVDVAVANEKGASLIYRQAVRDGSVGPVPTDSNKELSIVLGVYRGDKATVSVEVWMGRP